MANKTGRSVVTPDRAFGALFAFALPLTFASRELEWGDAATFLLSAAAIVPLARWIGEATEALAHRLGSGIGGLLNATFGNAAELILGFAALRAGKIQVVKASLTGSILGNLLLILGLSMIAGGWRRENQKVNAAAALAGSGMMFLSLVALALPWTYHAATGASAATHMLPMSIGVSIVMLVMYGLSLVFTMRTHAHLYTDESGMADHAWPPKIAVVILLLAAAATAVVAEVMVEAVEGASHSLGLTETFVGLVVVATVGNAAEHATAVLMAHKGRMNLAFNIAIESSKQIALFVAPVLVLLSLVFAPSPMSLEFTAMEVVGLGIGVGAATLSALDGETNWLDGAMLLAVYIMLAVVYYHTGP